MSGRNKNPQVVNPVFTNADLSKLQNPIKVWMFIFYDFFDWWYIQMPILYYRKLKRLMIVAMDKSSFSLLLQNFFTPFHRDSRAIGYLMGIVLRLIYLPLAGLAISFIGLLYILFILFWVLIPLITIIFIFLSPFI